MALHERVALAVIAGRSIIQNITPEASSRNCMINRFLVMANSTEQTSA
jgi:hypothetical protein